MSHSRKTTAATIMGTSSACERCKGQIHSNGMVGGEWKVDGLGGSQLVLTIYSRGERISRIVIDRAGHVVELEGL